VTGDGVGRVRAQGNRSDVLAAERTGHRRSVSAGVEGCLRKQDGAGCLPYPDLDFAFQPVTYGSRTIVWRVIPSQPTHIDILSPDREHVAVDLTRPIGVGGRGSVPRQRHG